MSLVHEGATVVYTDADGEDHDAEVVRVHDATHDATLVDLTVDGQRIDGVPLGDPGAHNTYHATATGQDEPGEPPSPQDQDQTPPSAGAPQG